MIPPIKRRDFITLLGGAAAAWPLAARAQQAERVRWVGVMIVNPDDHVGRRYSAAFELGLERLGWMVGRNIVIEYRFGVSDIERAKSAVAQILRLEPDVILANASSALIATQQATATVPIVFTAISEPVERGYVASLARPGGNVTGFTNLEATMGGKWLELFKEIAPRMKRVTAMFNPINSFATRFLHTAEAAAQKYGVEIITALVHNPAEIEAAVTIAGRDPDSGLMLPPDGFTPAHRHQIIDLVTRYRLPSITQTRAFAVDGGLMSYGADLTASYRQAAAYVDRILRGEKPANLPVQQPVKFELVINLKTAKALGLTVPLTLQVAADEVIE